MSERRSSLEPAPETAAETKRSENLALVFQEMLTAIVRLRSAPKSVSDADVFRAQVRHALKVADQEGKRLGYLENDIQLGTFAVVAFLDETILNLHNPAFNDWVRKPLQQELFGRHTAGEIFFEHLQQLLGRRDAPELADLLEVYELCLLLGFAGRYSISGRGELRAILGALADKIQRIRNSSHELSPHWTPPGETVGIVMTDPWARRLMIGAGGCAVLAVALFLLYTVSLHSGVSDLQSLAAQLSR